MGYQSKTLSIFSVYGILSTASENNSPCIVFGSMCIVLNKFFGYRFITCDITLSANSFIVVLLDALPIFHILLSLCLDIFNIASHISATSVNALSCVPSPNIVIG